MGKRGGEVRFWEGHCLSRAWMSNMGLQPLWEHRLYELHAKRQVLP
jgi:hypothetical protein